MEISKVVGYLIPTKRIVDGHLVINAFYGGRRVSYYDCGNKTFVDEVEKGAKNSLLGRIVSGVVLSKECASCLHLIR
jgi:hypothetical protein